MTVPELIERIVLTEPIQPPATGTGFGVYVYQGPEDVDRHEGAPPPMLVFRDEDRAIVERVCATVRHMATMSMKSVREVQQGERATIEKALFAMQGTRHQLAADTIRAELYRYWGQRPKLIVMGGGRDGEAEGGGAERAAHGGAAEGGAADQPADGAGDQAGGGGEAPGGAPRAA